MRTLVNIAPEGACAVGSDWHARRQRRSVCNAKPILSIPGTDPSRSANQELPIGVARQRHGIVCPLATFLA